MNTSGYAPAPAPDASHPPRVLVVDDDSAIRTLVTTVLVRNGYSVETARNGEEAIQTIVGGGFDAIILDLMMPKLDGFEVIDHLERAGDSERLKRCVIVLTAVSEKDLRKLDDSRVFRVIRKPFDLAELVGVVSECIASQRRAIA
jgi:CheY-like chemotaxis protein